MACLVGGSGAIGVAELCAGGAGVGLGRVDGRTAVRQEAPCVGFAVTVALGRVAWRCRAVAILGFHVVDGV
eukprot:8360306-Pyramimonas_sp.AAC.1